MIVISFSVLMVENGPHTYLKENGPNVLMLLLLTMRCGYQAKIVFSPDILHYYSK
jgi:hypothetical protein